MSLAEPSPGLLRASLEEFLARRREAAVTGFRCGGWSGPRTLEAGGRRCAIRWCPSTLAARETLAREPADELLVILTDRGDDDLGLDLLARLPHQRLLEINPWKALRQVFGASRLDPRLGEEGWLAEALLETVPPGGYPPLAAGTLDLDHAWATYLEHHLALTAGASDPAALLRWCVESAGPERLHGLAEDRARRVLEHLRRDGGGASAAIARLARRGAAADAVALGLVCRVLYSEGAVGTEAGIAGARLEERLGGETLSPADGRRWAEAAEAMAERWRHEPSGRGALRDASRRAEELLAGLKAAELARLSRWLRGGYRQRLERFATALSDALASTPAAVGGEVFERAAAVQNHRRASERALSCVAMAARLARWLAAEEAAPGTVGSLPEAAAHYAAELSFVDLARGVLWSHDPGAPLAEVFRALLARVASARQRFNRRFGELARGWFEADGEAPAVVPVEAVLERLVAPLAAHGRVLLLVADGMSFAVYHQLLGGLLERGWEPRIAGTESDGDGDSGDGEPLVALATVPGTTRVSRAALFSGRLETGGQSAEHRGFAAQPRLAAASAAGKPPVLFHKAALRDDGSGLAEEVRAALADRHRRLVAVVLNAVDDQLGRGDQLAPAWSVGLLRHLEAILEAAEDADRAVVLTADHGHLPEHDSELAEHAGAAGGERYRPADGAPAEGEVLVRGRRVVAAGGALIVPWSETLRYTPRKAGYHGGVSPQELLAPLAVLAPAGVDLPGWRHAAGTLPAWWEPRAGAEELPEAAAEPAAGRRTPPARRPEPAPLQGSLFEEAAAARAEPTAPTDAPGDPWAPLFASPVWRAQVERAGGPAFARDSRVRPVLALLARHGGRLSLAGAGRALNLGPPRLRSTVSQLQRLLNVDGYPVLDLDETAGELRLEQPLLAEQFELPG